MVCCCVAYGCKNRCSASKPNITFHRFPSSNQMLINAWVCQMRRKNWEPSSHSRVCSDHFTADCFIDKRDTSRRLLKKNAVPTVFNFPQDLPESSLIEEKPNSSFKEENPLKKLILNKARKKVVKRRVEESRKAELPTDMPNLLLSFEELHELLKSAVGRKEILEEHVESILKSYYELHKTYSKEENK